MNRLQKPADARALALLEELDTQYLEFARALPPPLSDMALRASTYSGMPSQESFAGVSGMNAVITCLPWLFWESFRELSDTLFLDVARGGAWLGMASVLLDHLIDGQAQGQNGMVLLHQALYEAGVAAFRRSFAPESAFWVHYDRLAQEHLSGMAIEVQAQTNPDSLTPEAFQVMASARIAPMLTGIAALAEVTNQPSLLAALEASIKLVIIAGQLYDDIGDWQEDLEAGRMTYYLSHLVPLEMWQGGALPPVEQVKSAIDANWSDVWYLRQVIGWFEDGLSAVSNVDCPAWRDYVTAYQTAADQHLTVWIARHLARSLRPLATRRADRSGPGEHEQAE